MSRLYLASAFAFLAGAAWLMYPSKQPDQKEPVGIEPDQMDAFGEPEPELSWLDWGTYNDVLLDDVFTMTETVEENAPALQYFSSSEFGEWWPLMDADLLAKLDRFRHYWGQPVMVSPVDGALGRHAGSSGSYHNVDKWGAVRAVDIFPQGLTPDSAKRAVECAEKAGLGGIGLYTDTQPSMMMHVDNRTTQGRWSRIDGDYKGIADAYA